MTFRRFGLFALVLAGCSQRSVEFPVDLRVTTPNGGGVPSAVVRVSLPNRPAIELGKTGTDGRLQGSLTAPVGLEARFKLTAPPGLQVSDPAPVFHLAVDGRGRPIAIRFVVQARRRGKPRSVLIEVPSCPGGQVWIDERRVGSLDEGGRFERSVPLIEGAQAVVELGLPHGFLGDVDSCAVRCEVEVVGTELVVVPGCPGHRDLLPLRLEDSGGFASAAFDEAIEPEPEPEPERISDEALAAARAVEPTSVPPAARTTAAIKRRSRKKASARSGRPSRRRAPSRSAELSVLKPPAKNTKPSRAPAARTLAVPSFDAPSPAQKKVEPAARTGQDQMDSPKASAPRAPAPKQDAADLSFFSGTQQPPPPPKEASKPEVSKPEVSKPEVSKPEAPDLRPQELPKKPTPRLAMANPPPPEMDAKAMLPKVEPIKDERTCLTEATKAVNRKRGFSDEVSQCITSINKNGPFYLGSVLVRARQLDHSGKLSDAKSLLEQGLQHPRGKVDIELYEYLARLHARSRNWEAVRSTCEMARGLRARRGSSKRKAKLNMSVIELLATSYRKLAMQTKSSKARAELRRKAADAYTQLYDRAQEFGHVAQANEAKRRLKALETKPKAKGLFASP